MNDDRDNRSDWDDMDPGTRDLLKGNAPWWWGLLMVVIIGLIFA